MCVDDSIGTVAVRECRRSKVRHRRPGAISIFPIVRVSGSVCVVNISSSLNIPAACVAPIYRTADVRLTFIPCIEYGVCRFDNTGSRRRRPSSSDPEDERDAESEGGNVSANLSDILGNQLSKAPPYVSQRLHVNGRYTAHGTSNKLGHIAGERVH